MARQTTIKDRIRRYGTVKWAEVEPLQSGDFKKYSPDQITKLKTSIVNNGFATPLFIWESKGKNILVDGFHRILAYKELSADGTTIPPEVPALFIDCKDRKDAKKFLLILNSHYAEIQKDALWDFVSDLDLDDLKAEIDISRMDLNTEEKQERDFSDKIKTRFAIEIECGSEEEQKKYYQLLKDWGAECRLLTL